MDISPRLKTFLAALADTSLPLDADTVEALASEAPWFALPAAMRLQRSREHGTPLPAGEEARLTSHVAVCSAQGRELTALIDRDSSLWANFYPADDTPARPDTSDAITTFLETYGHGASAEDDALLERLIFNPQPDYASVLEDRYGAEAAAEPPTDSHSAMIDAFLANPPHLEPEPAAAPPEPARPVTPQPRPEAASDSPLSESLAKIYIRQQRYDKAYEIISNLNLNFPEKSAYFADQLRFLQKLMLNRKFAEPRKETK